MTNHGNNPTKRNKIMVLYLPFKVNFKLPEKESCRERNHKNSIISPSIFGISFFGRPLCAHSDFKVVKPPEYGSHLGHSPLKIFWVLTPLKFM
jgi:hypothetical protein